MKFKKGDLLEAVSEGSGLTMGKIYKAIDMADSSIDCVRICDDNGRESYYFAETFTLHTQNQNTMNIPENCEAFDLEIALKEPERVVTRDGKPIEQIYHFDKIKTEWQVMVVIDGVGHPCTTEGVFYEDGGGRQLFLRAKESVKYYRMSNGYGCATKEDAINGASIDAIAIIEATMQGTRLTSVQIVHRF